MRGSPPVPRDGAAPTPAGGAATRSAPQGARIPALTGVRALAAFLIFFHHHRTSALVWGPLAIWWELHVGVTLFFVLSGFMITWRYDRQGPVRESFWRGYFINRFARIYPLYVALAVPTMLLFRERSPLVWFLNLTVFTSFGSGIAQAWSLRVEECFYLAAPLLFLGWRRGPLVPLLFGLGVLVALVPVAMLPATAGFLGPPRDLFLYTFFGRFFEFFVGAWLARRVAETGTADVARRVPIATLGGGAGIAATIVALSAIHAATGGAYTYGLYHPAGVALNNFVLPVFIATFYWGLIRERSLARSLLSGRVADLLGRSSYAFYLIHFGFLRDVLLARFVYETGRLSSAAGAWTAALVRTTGGLFLLVNLLAILLYAAIERPANRLLRRAFATPHRPELA
ncbi:MAG: acyltransferase family protein [Syntrophomonadaceae bacterium]